MLNTLKTLLNKLKKLRDSYLRPTKDQRREERLRLDIDEIIMPGHLWWLFTVLFGVGGTILYVTYRESLRDNPLGRILIKIFDTGINEALNAPKAIVLVVLVMFPMIPITILPWLASPREQREIYFLLHAGFKTLFSGKYRKPLFQTWITKTVRRLLWIGDIGLAKIGASLAATTLGIAIYNESQGQNYPFVTLGAILIICVLFIYPGIIRAQMAARYRSKKKF